jgi:hypothetical protein
MTIVYIDPLSRQRERDGVRVDMLSDGFPLAFILSPWGRGRFYLQDTIALATWCVNGMGTCKIEGAGEWHLLQKGMRIVTVQTR